MWRGLALCSARFAFDIEPLLEQMQSLLSETVSTRDDSPFLAPDWWCSPCARYRAFIESARAGEAAFRLSAKSEVSPYALCFAIFGLRLLRDDATLLANRQRWAAELRHNARRMRELRRHLDLTQDKPYLQLLTFSLSALHILDALEGDPLGDLVDPLVPADILKPLAASGAFQGRARSGNHAMFLAILALHARDYLGRDTTRALEAWVDAHLRAMNAFGFWGVASSMSHLQFQNGYHQYEILEYLHVDVPKWRSAAANVVALADLEGHFAPYPGGGGCYDYDAIFLITGAGEDIVHRYKDLLLRTARSILREQSSDGGFGESIYIRPRSLSNVMRTARHIIAARGTAQKERLRYGLTLLRPKHDRIHTHWTRYSRRWDESDLWDSWFRMLTLARIECALYPRRAERWGFIDHPGIGFHPSVRTASRS